MARTYARRHRFHCFIVLNPCSHMKYVIPILLNVLTIILGTVMPGETFGMEKVAHAFPPNTSPDHVESHWSYQGFRGPRLWGFLEDAYRECRVGHQQSPIDIVMPHHADHQEDLTFHYSNSSFQAVTTEHGLRIESLGTSRLILNQRSYRLRQFHFHDPSEHHIDGNVFPMEVHFVHEDANGHLLVVALLVKLGEKNSLLADLQQWVEQEEKPRALTNIKHPSNRLDLNVRDFLPHSIHHFSYHGSLTTPPCTQGVQWILLRTPTHLSQTQLNWFSSRIGTNARPIQPLDGRQVEEY